MNDNANALTSAELSDLADNLVDALSKSSGRDANRGIRATVQTVHEAEGTMEVIIDGDESSTVLPIESGAIGAQPGDRAYVKLEGREAYVASFRAKDATDRVRVIERKVEEIVPEVDVLADSIEEGRRQMDAVKAEADELKQTTPTKVELSHAVDKAKGEILTTIDGQYASEDDLKTLATKTEVEVSLAGIRTEVADNYINKETEATLATKSDLEQTSEAINLSVQATLNNFEGELTENYATKAELGIERDRITGVVQEATDLGERTSTLEQRSDGFAVSIATAQNSADTAQSAADSAQASANIANDMAEQTRSDVDQAINELDGVKSFTDAASAWMRFTAPGNVPTLELGQDGGAFDMRLTNQRLAFRQNGSDVAYLSNQELYIQRARVLSSLAIGDFSITVPSSGRLRIG